MAVDPDFWRGKRVFLTGHTGFKGSWLALWLQAMGAELQGYALAPPTSPSLFETARVRRGMASCIADVRDFEALSACMADFRPEVVIHMAAQPLVRASYREPVATYATNVMGTVHVLEAARQTAGVRCIVNVTTDKCYENKEWVWSYREDERLGGHDPYSNSKACSELVTAAYRQSFFGAGQGIALASARAGNVIGGGDWAAERLVPDILDACARGEPVVIRNPGATRPWQHVLEPLSGYLTLAQRLWQDGAQAAEGWNFGPHEADARPVQWITETLTSLWGGQAGWRLDDAAQPHEANFLKLDIAKARQRLGWQPRWNLEQALGMVVEWHKAWLRDEDMRDVCLRQIGQYQTTESS